MSRTTILSFFWNLLIYDLTCFIFALSFVLELLLTHFWPMFPFFTPWNQEVQNWNIGQKSVNLSFCSFSLFLLFVQLIFHFFRTPFSWNIMGLHNLVYCQYWHPKLTLRAHAVKFTRQLIKNFITLRKQFFFYLGFFHVHSRLRDQQRKGEAICVTPLYHFHWLHRHLDISRAITAECSPLHIASSLTLTGVLWFPSASL